MLDLAADVRATPTDASSPGNAVGRFEVEVFFEALVCDLNWTMLHVGVIAELSTACSRAHGEWTLRPWRHLAHDSAPIVHLALRYHPQLGLSADVAAQIRAFHDDLSEAKVQSRPLLGDVQSYSAAQLHALASLAARWRDLSKRGVVILQAIEGDVSQRLEYVYADDSRMLIQFLREAAAGDAHRVNCWGEIALPCLKQRRRTPRKSVERHCRIYFGDRQFDALLLDVSTEGVGISCTQKLVEGQTLDVDPGDERRLRATVVRCDGVRFGLRLANAIRRDDQLFGISEGGRPFRIP